MSISITRYVAITSGVGGGQAVKAREFVGRLFSTNPLIATQSLVEFTTPEDVGTYFGTTSEEYKRASFYFGWISKLVTKATKIGFARWANAATAPMVYSKPNGVTLAALAAIANGSLNLTMGTTGSVTPINLTGVGSFAAAAAIIQTAIRATAGAQFTLATCTYDAPSGRFLITGGVVAVAAMSVNASGVGTDLGPVIGFSGVGSIPSNGVAAETLTQTLDASKNASNNFGGFLFLTALSAAQKLEVAQWTKLQNVAFMFMNRALLVADAQQSFTDQAGLAGVAVTYSPLAAEYDEMIPMIIWAATDYSKLNSVQAYMYQQFALTAKVTDNTTADQLDAARGNYYGQTQTAGQNLAFYQRGTLMGLSTDPVDMNTFANEAWLKDAAAVAVLNLLIALARVSANATGRTQLLTVLMGVINAGLKNGTISPGKTLTVTQQLYITALSGRDRAWQQVQNAGWWIDCNMVSYVGTGGATEYKAVYTLIYSKDDNIRKVEGSHVLI